MVGSPRPAYVADSESSIFLRSPPLFLRLIKTNRYLGKVSEGFEHANSNSLNTVLGVVVEYSYPLRKDMRSTSNSTSNTDNQ